MPALGKRLNAIHQQLLNGSRTASLDLFKEALGPVTGRVLRSTPGMTKEEAQDHAIAAIIAHIDKPGVFDPTKSSLWTYLCLIATRDAADAVRQRHNRAELMEKHQYEIELWGVQPNNDYDNVEWKKDAEKIMRLHGGYIVQNDREKRVLDLMLEGERDVAAYVKALGLTEADAAAEVKRVKDRISLRMKKVRDEL
jgi:DNA-directed RNA polymerase specialized sigma24 family protein